MHKKTVFSIIIVTAILLIFVPMSPAKDKSPIEDMREKIIQEIESLEIGLEAVKSCVARAVTEADLIRCREEEKIRKYQEIQEMLFEMGMSWEERRIKRLRPRELP